MAEPYRKAGCLLMIGIFLLPIIFVWFVLRDGYSTTTRVISVIWLLIVMGGGVHQTERVLNEPAREVNSVLS